MEPYLVTGRSFIPANSVPNPMAPMSNTKSFKGDNRQSYQANASSFRTEQKVRVDFDNKKVSTLSNVASGSIGVDNKGLETEKSLATKAGPNPSYDKGLLEKGNSTTIGMQVDASNKLVNGAPAINYDVNITISQQSNGSLDYKINGASDGFPAYEFFITNEATGNSTLIYGSNPTKTGDTPMALFPPMEKKINSSGNINDRKEDEQH
ncbi:MAG: DUF3238 domain-containing protein [Dyadobacter sp.]|uniref:DUF3238 domain-containing protein n=1 Tax=Dyadobacter sp. TaxID=1914288 RepID=UPI003264BBA5